MTKDEALKAARRLIEYLLTDAGARALLDANADTD
jgi:hypothetical protein